jgi:protein-S-isoprenylcysteine O-methyltransferase Ste14
MRKSLAAVSSIALSIFFSFALLYSTLELPLMVNEFLMSVTPHYGIGDLEEAERFIDSVKPIGYLCLGITLALMVLGFVLKKYKFSLLGSFVILLPTFSYFASVMFFLAGIGILRVVWLPFIELSRGSSIYEKISVASSFLELGDVVYLPYDALRNLLKIVLGNSLSLDEVLFTSIIVASSILFFISCATWFYLKFQNGIFAKSFVYKYSRHPQYLSFLLWSYGLLVYDKYVFSPPRGGYFAPPPLFWTIFVFLIVGIALKEEEAMLEKYGREYENYRLKTPFMIPLSKTIGRIIVLPTKLVFKKSYPERISEITVVLAIYLVIVLLASLLY